MITVIIVEYHSGEELAHCLASTRSALEALPHEIIVISNSEYGSTDYRLQRLRQVVSPDRLILTAENVGFARAVNAGLREARGDYVFLLNPDCVVVAGSIGGAIAFMQADPRIALLGPRLVDGNGNVQESARAFISPAAFMRRVIARFLGLPPHRVNGHEQLHEVRPVDWVSGACMLVKKTAIDRVGMMDERYFMYVEDMDWCRAFHAHCYAVVYWPDLVVRHSATHASSMALSRWVPSRLMWIHFMSYCKFLWKVLRGARITDHLC